MKIYKAFEVMSLSPLHAALVDSFDVFCSLSGGSLSSTLHFSFSAEIIKAGQRSGRRVRPNYHGVCVSIYEPKIHVAASARCAAESVTLSIS